MAKGFGAERPGRVRCSKVVFVVVRLMGEDRSALVR